MPEPSDATDPSVEATYAFQADQAPEGPTVSRGLFRNSCGGSPMKGFHFLLVDPLVASWNCLPDGYVAAQQEPLKLADVLARFADRQSPLGLRLLHFAGLRCRWLL